MAEDTRNRQTESVESLCYKAKEILQIHFSLQTLPPSKRAVLLKKQKQNKTSVLSLYTISFLFRRGKGRTQISLLPRSLYRQSAPDAKAENGTVSAPHATVTDGVDGGPGTTSLDTQTKSLSNEDFARMLLKKWNCLQITQEENLPSDRKPCCVLTESGGETAF